MEIKSLAYILFLLITIIIYFASCRKQSAQRLVLIIANISFILFVSDLRSLFIIFFLVTLAYFMGILIEKAVKEKNKKKSQILMWVTVVFFISFLCYFKYFKQSFEILREALSSNGFEISKLLTPIGLSYYSLSLVAYIIDVYHKKHAAETNYLDFLAFVTFFPAIVEGPFGLYRSIGKQFKQVHYYDWNRMVSGLQRILWGYFKKVVIADRIGIIVLGVLSDEGAVGLLVFWIMVLYSFQIYTDFSGGIDVIMGVAEIMGFDLLENFNAPFMAKSVTEFWQRWHMSFGEVMEKYVYFPLVLNKSVIKFSKKIKNKYFQRVFAASLASFIVFVLVGIWHGTGWNYVVYGCYQAFFVSSAVFLGPMYKKAKAALHINDTCMSWQIFQIIRTFVILVFGRMLTRAKDLEQGISLIKRTFSAWNPHVLFDGTLFGYGLDYKNYYLMIACIVLVMIIDVLHYRGMKIRETIMKQDIVFRYAIYMAALFVIIIFGIYGSQYSASSFIYQGF